jgi:hypothetical protein
VAFCISFSIYLVVIPYDGLFWFKALDSTTMLGFNAALFVLVAGGLGMTAPVQGGIGAYHLLVSAALVLFDVVYIDGLAFATLLHTAQMIQIVALGLLAILGLAIMQNKLQAIK